MDKNHRKWIISTISIVIILFLGTIVTINYNRGINITNFTNKEKKIEKNDWVNIKSVKKDEVLIVKWDQKYGLSREEYCKAVFYNKNEGLIKLVAPWLDITIIKTNMHNIEFKVISMDSVPNINK